MGWDVISLPFSQGLDTRTDPKMLDVPKLVLLQDCLFTQNKRLSKRNGTTALTLNIIGGGTILNPKLIQGYKNELVCAGTASAGALISGQRLYSYSEDLGEWKDQGYYNSVGVFRKTISAGPLSTFGGTNDPVPLICNGYTNASHAIIGNLALFVYDIGYGSSNIFPSNPDLSTLYSVLDLETGTFLVRDTPISNLNIGWGRAVVLGTGTPTFAILYMTGPNTLRFRTLSVSIGAGNSSGVTLGTETVIGTSLAKTTPGAQYPYFYCYDVITTAAGATVAVSDSPNLVLYTITATPSSATLATITASGGSAQNVQPVSINQEPVTNRYWIYWGVNNSGTLNYYYAVYSSAGASVLGKTTVDTPAETFLSQITAISTGSGTQLVFYSSLLEGSGGYPASIVPYIRSATVTSTGTVVLIGIFQLNCDILGKAIAFNGSHYLPIYSISATDSTGFLIDLGSTFFFNNACAKFLSGEAEGIYANLGNPGGLTPGPIPLGIRYPGFINSPVALSSTQLSICAGFIIQLFTAPQTVSGTGYSYPANATLQTVLGVAMSTFDFAHIDAYQSLVENDTVVLNGGIVSQYDSAEVSEVNFNLFPDNIAISVSGSGGDLSAGTYTLYATFQWTDGQGNLQESAPSLPIIVITTGTTSSLVWSIPILTLTQKYLGGDVFLCLYRTLVNGTVPFLLTRIDLAGLLSTTPIVTFTDILADVNLKQYPPLYTEGNAILENTAPPPSLILWSNLNRVWAIDSENNETTIDYSKTISAGSGISFSVPTLEVIIDSKLGVITAAGPMDQNTVILKQNGLGFFYGDGENDAGTGSTITPFQFIPSDTGCSNSKSFISFPAGILFRASNSKGIYFLSRGIQLEYFGRDVQAYNSQDIQSALIIPNTTQIRFLTSSGVSLLYDYTQNQWSVFTNYTGLSSSVWQGNYVYVRTDGSIYEEDQSGTYLDNGTPFGPVVIPSWIKATSIQGMTRCRRIMLLGDLLGINAGHGVQVSLAFNFIPSFSAPIPYIFPGPNTVYQYRERLPRQKFDSFQIMIQEIVTGASGEFIDFSDLGLEIQGKTGLHKLPASASVG